MAIDLDPCRENFRQRVAARWLSSQVRRAELREATISAILQVIPAYPQGIEVHLFGSVT